MFYVYIPRSESHPEQTYVGFTQNLKKRLLMHNQGGSSHTAKYVPWRIEFYCAFKHEDKASLFEITFRKSFCEQATALNRSGCFTFEQLAQRREF